MTMLNTRAYLHFVSGWDVLALVIISILLILGIIYLGACIMSTGDNFLSYKSIHQLFIQPIKIGILAFVVCFEIEFWMVDFLFHKPFAIEDFQSLELIEELHPDSLKTTKTGFTYNIGEMTYNIYVKDNNDYFQKTVRTVQEDIDTPYIEYYIGHYSHFPLRGEIDCYILHLPKEGK